MKIKIGPITAQYKGTVKIQEADEANHTVAMRAQAKDARGQGTRRGDDHLHDGGDGRGHEGVTSSPTCASPARPPSSAAA